MIHKGRPPRIEGELPGRPPANEEDSSNIGPPPTCVQQFRRPTRARRASPRALTTGRHPSSVCRPPHVPSNDGCSQMSVVPSGETAPPKVSPAPLLPEAVWECEVIGSGAAWSNAESAAPPISSVTPGTMHCAADRPPVHPPLRTHSASASRLASPQHELARPALSIATRLASSSSAGPSTIVANPGDAGGTSIGASESHGAISSCTTTIDRGGTSAISALAAAGAGASDEASGLDHFFRLNFSRYSARSFSVASGQSVE